MGAGSWIKAHLDKQPQDNARLEQSKVLTQAVPRPLDEWHKLCAHTKSAFSLIVQDLPVPTLSSPLHSVKMHLQRSEVCTDRYAGRITNCQITLTETSKQTVDRMSRHTHTHTGTESQAWQAVAKGAHHEGADVFGEVVVLAAGQEALGAPAGRLLPGGVHGLQAARQVGAPRHAHSADLVVRRHPPRHHRHHRVLSQRLLHQPQMQKLCQAARPATPL